MEDIRQINQNFEDINIRYKNTTQEFINSQHKYDKPEEVSYTNVTDYVIVNRFSNSEILHVKIDLKRATANEAHYFKNYLSTFVEPDNNKFILDFSKSVFIDSTFLGAVVYIYKRISALEGTLILVMDNKQTILSTAIDSLSKIFKIYPTLDQAFQAAA